MQVECNYHGQGKWFPARISNVRSDGTYDVMYDDGDKEFKMKPDTIRILEKVGHHKKIVGNVPVDGPDFKEGSVVEARYKGK